MEEQDVTTLIDELAQYAQLLDASFDDQNLALLLSVAAQVRKTVIPLYEVLVEGPKSWGPAHGGAWIAIRSAGQIEEQLGLSDVDWERVAAAVAFTVSGLEEMAAGWSRVLRRDT